MGTAFLPIALPSWTARPQLTCGGRIDLEPEQAVEVLARELEDGGLQAVRRDSAGKKTLR